MNASQFELYLILTQRSLLPVAVPSRFVQAYSQYFLIYNMQTGDERETIIATTKLDTKQNGDMKERAGTDVMFNLPRQALRDHLDVP